jgi:hypothetical protein
MYSCSKVRIPTTFELLCPRGCLFPNGHDSLHKGIPLISPCVSETQSRSSQAHAGCQTLQNPIETFSGNRATLNPTNEGSPPHRDAFKPRCRIPNPIRASHKSVRHVTAEYSTLPTPQGIEQSSRLTNPTQMTPQCAHGSTLPEHPGYQTLQGFERNPTRGARYRITSKSHQNRSTSFPCR